jgi:hypothetical protein
MSISAVKASGLAARRREGCLKKDERRLKSMEAKGGAEAMSAAMVMVLVMSVSAADVSGVWSLRLLTSAGESAPRATVTLQQDGEKLTGKCAIDQTDQDFTVVGHTTGNTLTWRCVGKEAFEVSFKGTVDETGRQMTGEWATHASAQGTFKGSRPPK